jgi:hypothetical protein
MKPIIPFALLGALFAFGAVQAAETTPVGYYQFNGVTGGNLFVPGFVKPAAYAGVLTAASGTTLTVAANSFTAGAYNTVAPYATHYAEITSGPNAGVNIDIVSNTTNQITLKSSITALNLVGTESIAIRPHVTLRETLQGGEAGAGYNVFSDSVTFYELGGAAKSYLYTDTGVWSSDFGTTSDGNLRPIPPGTGFVLSLITPNVFSVTGEVKTAPTVVQLTSTAPNIVGAINPLVGDSTKLSDLGFENMTPYTDSVTAYVPGALSIIATYLPDGTGELLDGSFLPTNAALPHTTGVIVTAAGGDTAVKLQSGL